MSKKLFTSEEIKQLKQNTCVKSVSEKGITYTKEFKENFIKMSEKGHLPREIFEAHGFDLSVLGMSRMASAAKRWRRAYQAQGALGLDDELISKSTGLSLEEIEKLRQEQDKNNDIINT